MEYVLSGIIILLIVYILYDRKDRLTTQVENSKIKEDMKELQTNLVNIQEELGKERDKSKTLLSQKKSSETRIGNLSEHLIPFLDGCPYDPRNLKFFGQPIDYISIDFDLGEIVFIEVKSGNSKASKRQKTIKNIIKSGRVYYAEMRVNEKGVQHKKFENSEKSLDYVKEEV
jgi:predicted Holliday junction resolvase-like endonuclease